MQNFFNGRTDDLVQIQSTMQAIEHACSEIQMHANPAIAEATLLSLRQSPQLYQTCKFILENSQVAIARFQAAAAIRDAAIREWGILSADDKRSLVSFCLCFVIQHASSPDAYVQVKVSAVGAQLMKRGWPDFMESEKEAFLSEVKMAVLGNHGVAAQFFGINFLESMVSEFSPVTSTDMGLPREFHEQCRASLELHYLKKFYSWAQEAAFGVTRKVVECDSTVVEVKVCAAALRLMLQIMTWDFQLNKNAVERVKSINVFSSGVRNDAMLLKKSEFILVQPGPSWRDVLISSGHIGWLLGLYGALRQKFSCEAYWLDSPIAVSARNLIIQLCSLAGTIFPSDNGQMQERHLVQMLSGIIPWIHPPDIISAAIEHGKSESELLDGCRALLYIASLTSPMVFDKLLKSLRSVACSLGTLSLLSSLTCEVVKARMADNTEEETWNWIARDILLDTWTAILQPPDNGKDAELPPDGIRASASVFNLIVESELKVAAASAFDDGDGSEPPQASISGIELLSPSSLEQPPVFLVFSSLSLSLFLIIIIFLTSVLGFFLPPIILLLYCLISAMDERLSSYALLARAAIDVTIPLLTQLFSERFTLLHHGRGTSDPTCTLEELYSLLLITGHILADEGEGETPLVPEALQAHFVDIVEAKQHPVVVLSCSILKFAEQSLDTEIRAAFFSPRLMEAVIWFLARWSDTYLMPLEGGRQSNCNPGHDSDCQLESQVSKKALLSFFGEHNQGKLVLDIIVKISMTTLVSYPGEKQLQELTCCQLLPAVVRRKNVCAHLVTLDSWRNLANAFANGRSLFTLTATHQRSLAETLIRSAAGMRNSEASNQYVRDLMGQMTAYLVDISSDCNLKNVAQQPDAILSVSCLLERLRGAARASQPRTQKAIFEMGISVMNPVLTLLEIYKHESAVVYFLLKFVVDWVDGQVIFLEAKDTTIVVTFCMQLLQLYSSHNIGKISLSLSSSLLSEARTEKYKDLRALLQLLTNLCSKDLVDFSSDSNEAERTDIAQVIYLGLHIVTPLISLEMLKYPKLCRDYFALVSHILEVYPEKFAQLNNEAFAHIVGTLDFGIHHQDTEIVNMCLRALNALASYHYKETGAGKEGLGSHVAGMMALGGKLQEGILSRFLRVLLELLLFEECSTELVSSAADALLPLILCEQALYQRLGHELIERQVNPQLKSRLANALQCLTGTNELSSSLDRINRQKFRKNLYVFLVEVRGFLRTK
ncbi:exportin-4 isoform X3 [Macadamia integrifolia]|uniref:exportin-4 isoform X3 n=1 Tax=Macadamia integrifolia TaxID=60698 RepID=UPI001C4EE0D7|nr:exportin-4 isoform X3 [Macadamia integrifolia]